MPHVVRFAGPRQVEVAEYDEPPLAPGEVRIATLYSGISAGTELTAYRGSNPYLNKKWDAERRLFIPGATTFDYPVDGWGYEEVGRVVEVAALDDSAQGADGAPPVRVGDVVWGTWGHRETVVKSAEYAAARRLPTGIDPINGIFSQIGAIALNVVLDADIHVGETVAVFGLGVPGQLVAQLARLNGAHVIGVDMLESRRDVARRLGAWETIDAARGEVAEQIRALTGGRGADVCLEVSGSYPALHEAIRSVAYNSRVVAAGFFQREGTGLALGEEFHHNRVQVICSQISGVAPHLQHRWDLERLQQTFMRLACDGRLDLAPLVTHRIPARDAARAFALVDQHPADVLQVVLEY
ncbi:MAG TPA: zinc-binding alcohol dehydrogenase [Actinopolymorphaceae bacterium]|jgi:2-desacetyl-2-hydroxyethyl bacteriochlorophyllide A dehydrogenase